MDPCLCTAVSIWAGTYALKACLAVLFAVAFRLKVEVIAVSRCATVPGDGPSSELESHYQRSLSLTLLRFFYFIVRQSKPMYQQDKDLPCTNCFMEGCRVSKAILRAGGVAMRSGHFELFESLRLRRLSKSCSEVCVKILHVPNNHNYQHSTALPLPVPKPTGWKAASDWNRVNAAHPEGPLRSENASNPSPTALIIRTVPHIFYL